MISTRTCRSASRAFNRRCSRNGRKNNNKPSRIIIQQIALSRLANRNKSRQSFRKNGKTPSKNKISKAITDSSRT